MTKTKSSFNLLFYIAVFFIPFDNLFFAPSSGWATISPLIFFLFIILNIPNLRNIRFNKKVLILVLSLYLISVFNYTLSGFDVNNLINALFPLVLGLSFYISLKLFLSTSVNSKMIKIVKILSISYCISYLYGIMDYFNILNFSAIAEVLSKRYYYHRLQFTFTEPSFISMHVYGVILPVILLTNNKIPNKNLKQIFCLFVLTSLLLSDSSKFFIDSVAILSIYALYKVMVNKKTRKAFFVSIPFVLIFAFLVYNYMLPDRIVSIINQGVYADSSLASRFFRINAVCKGMFDNLYHMLFGYGYSNVYIPLGMGYDRALLEYANSYMNEVIRLKGAITDSIISMPVRMFAEFGIVGLLLFSKTLFSKKHLLLFLIFAFLYLQFDSYAFYTMWILLFVKYSNFEEAL